MGWTLKIALIRRRYTDFGGAERYAAALAHALADRGHEVHLYAEAWNAAGGKAVFHRVPVMPGPAFLGVLSFAHTCARMLRGQGYDIVHSFERTWGQDVYRAGDGCHREWLIRRREVAPFYKRWTMLLNPLHATYLYLEKRMFTDPTLKKVISNSHRGKEEIVRHYAVDPSKIRVIHNGLDLNRFRADKGNPLEDVGESRFVLFVGSGFERKGLATAIGALSRIPDPDLRLVVVGKDRPGRYEKLARRLGVEGRVWFMGPRKHVEAFYRKASVFLLPSLYEPFGNACLEASAFGLPVITTRVTGFSELIRPGENGFILEDPLDEDRAALLVSEALAMGRVQSRNLPTLDENVEQVLRIYEEIGDRA